MDEYLQTHPACIKLLQMAFPGVELNELIDAVRRAGPEKESIYKFVECHFRAGKSVPVLTKAYSRASYSVKQKSL